jgi:hypothetical protein
MGKFDEYLSGKVHVEVGKEKLELDIRLKDKRKFKTLAGNQQASEESLELIDNAILEILYRSYPDESKESMEAFYFKNDTEFLNKIMIAFGWAKEEDFQKIKN